MSGGATNVVMDHSAALASFMRIFSFMHVRPYMQLIRMGVLDRDEAARRIDEDATLILEMKLPECFIGVFISEALRDYAGAVRRPSLSVVDSGGDERW